MTQNMTYILLPYCTTAFSSAEVERNETNSIKSRRDLGELYYGEYSEYVNFLSYNGRRKIQF